MKHVSEWTVPSDFSSISCNSWKGLIKSKQCWGTIPSKRWAALWSVSWARRVQQPGHLWVVGPSALAVSLQLDSSAQRHSGQMLLCYQAALIGWKHSSIFQGHLQPENRSNFLLFKSLCSKRLNIWFAYKATWRHH